MSRSHTRLLIIVFTFSVLSALIFGIGFHNGNHRLMGLSFIFMLIAVFTGLITNWKHVGSADITTRAGGDSSGPLHDKMHKPRSSIKAGEVVSQDSYKKGERGYLGVVFLFGAVLLLFLIVAIALIIWGGG